MEALLGTDGPADKRSKQSLKAPRYNDNQVVNYSIIRTPLFRSPEA